MYKKVRLAVKFSLLFMIIAAIYNYSAVSVMAANRIVKVKNGTSGEIRIKEDDFVTFIPKLKSNKNKKKQPLSLLSGGEKSMVAIAFIMAIFMYKPSPFTFLDEIEAALDEKNTKNLLGKLRDFTDKSQFILITHNKETMKESDSIFGVTMNKEIGISKIVSPDKITKILSENKENN